MISMEKALLLDRRMRALTGLDGRAFLKLERRFARVLAQELATRTRPVKRANAPQGLDLKARRAARTISFPYLQGGQRHGVPDAISNKRSLPRRVCNRTQRYVWEDRVIRRPLVASLPLLSK